MKVDSMFANIEEQKSLLRAGVRAEIKKLSAAARVQESSLSCVRLTQQAVWKNARSIAFFAPMPDEPDIWPLLAEALTAGKVVALPAFVPGTNNYVARQIHDPVSDLMPGKFGVREPSASCMEVPLNRLDLVLVPGVAFDAHGRRLGRGKGFYDRLLANVRGKKCGIAFDEQIVGEVPSGPHDIQLNCILTPTRWIET